MADADFLRECAREYEDSAYACDTPLLRGFHAARMEKAKRLRELAARSPAPTGKLSPEDAAAFDAAILAKATPKDEVAWVIVRDGKQGLVYYTGAEDRIERWVPDHAKARRYLSDIVANRIRAEARERRQGDFVGARVEQHMWAAPILEEREADALLDAFEVAVDDCRIAPSQGTENAKGRIRAELLQLCTAARSAPPDQHPEASIDEMAMCECGHVKQDHMADGVCLEVVGEGTERSSRTLCECLDFTLVSPPARPLEDPEEKTDGSIPN